MGRARPRRMGGLAVLAIACLSAVGPAAALTADEVNGARMEAVPAQPEVSKASDAKPEAAKTSATKAADGVDPATLRAQVLLDRQRFSPGSIDGRPGDNFGKALDAFAAAHNVGAGGHLTPEVFAALVASDDKPVLVTYTVTEADLKGPFLKEVPKTFEAMAELDHLGYTSAREELGERFHVSPKLLELLNPGASFERVGETLTVAAVRPEPEASAISNRNAVPADGGKAPAVRVVIDKSAHALSAYDGENHLIAFYPASIGSEEKPAPSGDFKIRAIARNPTYTYDPEYAFKGVHTKKKITVPAGPNNPVGVVWLDLTADSYGIHGAPEPERIGKTYSHGCVRLTNWDIKDLATLAGRGTRVEFKD